MRVKDNRLVTVSREEKIKHLTEVHGVDFIEPDRLTDVFLEIAHRTHHEILEKEKRRLPGSGRSVSNGSSKPVLDGWR
jgi:hypothetical protein